MTKDTFQEHLIEATNGIVRATKEYVEDSLPEDVRFLIVPNCSYDGNPLEDDEEVFSEEKLPEWTTKPPTDVAGAVNDLYRGGKVPEWINVYVDSSDDRFTYVLLECCARFTAMGRHLYHAGTGMPPFSPKIAMPSLDYELETNGKFRLSSKYNHSEQISGDNR